MISTVSAVFILPRDNKTAPSFIFVSPLKVILAFCSVVSPLSTNIPPVFAVIFRGPVELKCFLTNTPQAAQSFTSCDVAVTFIEVLEVTPPLKVITLPVMFKFALFVKSFRLILAFTLSLLLFKVTLPLLNVVLPYKLIFTPRASSFSPK